MKLDDIIALWDEDSEMDDMNMDRESVKMTKLHSKYYRILLHERFVLAKLEAEDYKTLFHLKTEYFLGTLDKETLQERGWAPNPRAILKTDIPRHLEADPEIIALTLKIAAAKEKVRYLESIIKAISDRNYTIRNFNESQKIKYAIAG
jgi:hypothetical protein